MRALAFALGFLALTASASAKGIERVEVCDRFGCVDVAPVPAFMHGGRETPEPLRGDTYVLRFGWGSASSTSDYRGGFVQAGDGGWYRLPAAADRLVRVGAAAIVPTTAVRAVLDAAGP